MEQLQESPGIVVKPETNEVYIFEVKSEQLDHLDCCSGSDIQRVEIKEAINENKD